MNEVRKGPVVHILYAGHALCGKEGPPSLWPNDHRWIGLDEPHRANCPDCCQKALTHPARVSARKRAPRPQESKPEPTYEREGE